MKQPVRRVFACHLRWCSFSKQVEENSRLKAELERSILELAKYVSILRIHFFMVNGPVFCKIIEVICDLHASFAILPRNQINPCPKLLIPEITQMLLLCLAWFTSQLTGSRMWSKLQMLIHKAWWLFTPMRMLTAKKLLWAIVLKGPLRKMWLMALTEDI